MLLHRLAEARRSAAPGQWQCADPPTPREAAALADRVRSALEPTIARVKAMGFDFVALTSGTAFAMAGLAARIAGGQLNGQSKIITFRTLCEVEKKLLSLPAAERAKLPGIDPRRADTIAPGAILLRAILELAGVDEATLCEPALREGIIADYVAKNRPGIQLVEEFPDQRRRVVMELARARLIRKRTRLTCLLAVPFPQRAICMVSQSDAALEYSRPPPTPRFYISGNRIPGTRTISHDPDARLPQAEVQSSRSSRVITANAPRGAPVLLDCRAKLRKSVQLRRVASADSVDRPTQPVLACASHSTPRPSELRLEPDDDPDLELWRPEKGDLSGLFGRRLARGDPPPQSHCQRARKGEIKSCTRPSPQASAHRASSSREAEVGC